MIPGTHIPGADLLFKLDLISTILSTFASAWMVYSCFKIPGPKSTSLKLIWAVAIADLVYSITNIMSNFQTVGHDDFCIFEAYIRQFAFVLSMFFSTCIAIASYKISTLEMNSTRNSFFAKSLAIGIFLCIFQFFATFLFFPENDVVVARGPFFCWITHSKNASQTAQLVIIMFVKGVLIFLGFFITIYSYVHVIKKTKELPQDILSAAKFNYYHVLWYPAVFFITFIPNLIDNILRIYYPERPIWIQAFHLVLTHSVGLSNALVYGVQRKLFKTNYEQEIRKYSEFDTSYLSLSRNSTMIY